MRTVDLHPSKYRLMNVVIPAAVRVRARVIKVAMLSIVTTRVDGRVQLILIMFQSHVRAEHVIPPRPLLQNLLPLL